MIRKLLSKILLRIPFLGKQLKEYGKVLQAQNEYFEEMNKVYREYYKKNPQLLTDEQKKKLDDLEEKRKKLGI